MTHLFKTVVWEEPEQSLGPQCCKAKASFPLNYYNRKKEEYKKTEDENSEHENGQSNVRVLRRIINCGIKSERSPALNTETETT